MEQKIFFFSSVHSTCGVKLPKHIHLVLSNISSFLYLQLQKTVVNPLSGCFKWPILPCTASYFTRQVTRLLQKNKRLVSNWADGYWWATYTLNNSTTDGCLCSYHPSLVWSI